MEEKTIITGTINNYIYESDESLYKVCELVLDDDSEVIIVGSFPRLDEGLSYEFVGSYREHPKYGKQFFVESYSKSDSLTKSGLLNYLSSGKFYGIGPKIAENIINKLGLDCIKKILADQTVLEGISGLTKPKAEALYTALKDNYLEEQCYIELYGYGLTSKMVAKLYEKYGNSAANKVVEDPYRLITEVDGFGFKKSDNLALKLGIDPSDMRRIKASLVYTLNYVCYQNGFTYLTKEQLINSAKSLITDISLADEDYINAISDLVMEKKIIEEDERIFDYYLYNAEIKCKDKILKLNEIKSNFSRDDVKEALKYVKDLVELEYTPLQEDAIINCLSNKLSIITGGPGTGKSTILKGILLCYAKLLDISPTDEIFSYKVCMVAPTGRAAKRMADTTNHKATTIHKALGYNYTDSFSRDENNPLNASLLIVDEASMLDISLASSLFRALPNKCQVILIGDSNQLPSVGPGNVLADLINTSIFKTTTLTQIMRQAKDSDIIALSNMVLQERINYSILSKKNEIFFYDRDAKDTIEGIFKILDNFISKGGDLQNEIEILAPMYAGVAGIDAINQAIQERYNHEEKMIVRDNKVFKKNDKVLQLKNDSILDIMNGDIGKIIDIVKSDEKDALLIDFDGRVVTYMASDLDNLSLAYAISVHKAQGSEFDNVILPVLPSYQIMLRKKLLYTAITRAKKKLIIIGKIDSIEKSLYQTEGIRQTALYQRLENKPVSQEDKIFDPEIPFDTFGEYDMEGITPYSFMNKA
ncbi:MAG: ATP-dependent RecD-like DNA helicase [Acholeplasmatales bacterium]|nr:ATP-dependent RecD-like DNA helicase [Acholeplasmatales bacterium]